MAGTNATSPRQLAGPRHPHGGRATAARRSPGSKERPASHVGRAVRGGGRPPTMAPPGVEITVSRSLGRHAARWDELVDGLPRPTPFLRSWWLEHTAEGDPCFLLVTQEGRLLGGMALEEDRHLGVATYRALGQGTLAPDHLDAVVDHAHRIAVEAALRGWCHRPGQRRFDLDGIVPASTFARILPTPLRQEEIESARARSLDQVPAGEAPAPTGVEEKTLRRGRRRFGRAGGIHHVLVHDIDAALARFRELHTRRWGERSGLLGRYDAFAAAVRAGSTHGEVVLHELVLDDRPLVVLVEFWVAGRVSVYQDGRDPESPVRSIGTVAQGLALEHAHQQGMREYDLLRGDQPYKHSWADLRLPLFRLHSTHGVYARAVDEVLRGWGWLADRKGQLRRAVQGRAAATAAALRAFRQRSSAKAGVDDGPDVDGLEVAVVRDPEELALLRDSWTKLTGEVGGPNSQLDWVLASLAATPQDRLWAVTVRDRGELVGVLPLVQRRGVATPLRLIDTDAHGPRVRDAAAHRALMAAVLDLRRPLVLGSLPADGPTVSLVAELAGPRRLRARTVMAGGSVRLGDGAGEPFALLSSRSRNSVRRRQRRAGEHGEVRLEVTGDADGDLLSAFEAFVDLEAAGWKRRAGTALVCDTTQRDLLERYLRSRDGRASVRILRLWFGDHLAAMQILAMVEGRCWMLKSTYDERFSASSPGLLLNHHAIAWAARQGASHFELMGDREPYKDALADPSALTHLRVYPATARGAARFLMDATGKAARAIERRSGRREHEVDER